MEYSQQSTTNQHNNTRVSVVLKDFLDNTTDQKITIGALKNAIADRAFGILMLIFTLPNLIPLPIPGISIFFGIPLLFLAFQLVIGKKSPWFPAWLANKHISHKDFSTVLFYAIPYIVRIERILRPRLSWLVQPPSERFIAALCMLMAVLITLPIPLGNWLPALSICLFSLAILEHDGLFAVFGIIASCASLVLVSSIVIAFIHTFIYFLGDFFA